MEEMMADKTRLGTAERQGWADCNGVQRLAQ